MGISVKKYGYSCVIGPRVTTQRRGAIWVTAQKRLGNAAIRRWGQSVSNYRRLK